MRKFFLMLVVFSGVNVQAEETKPVISTPVEAVQAPAPAKWKATLASSFVELRGTKEADANAYSIGEVRSAAQTLGVEYAVAKDWNLSLRGQYLNHEWQLTRAGRTSGEHTHGMGDTLLAASHVLAASPSFRLLGDAGIYLPTGSIDEVNPYAPPGTHYVYRMQLGSGTVDPALGLTSIYLQPAFNIGGRLSSVIRTGENSNGYRLGNIYRADVWSDFPMRYGLTPRLTGFYRHKEQIHGQDRTLVPFHSALQIYDHDQMDWAVSAGIKFERPLSKTLAVNAEVGVPFYQGMRNNDHVEVSARYFANLGVGGQF